MILVLDIDGTLVDVSHREHFVQSPEKDWDSFLDPENVSRDLPIPEAQEALPNMLEEAEEVFFLTGRPERLRDVTLDQLEEYYGLSPTEDELYMRPDDDIDTPDYVLKEEVAQALVEEYGDQEFMFVEDRADNIKVLKKYGEVLEAPECWKEYLEEMDQ